jgi:hypothetical protein
MTTDLKKPLKREVEVDGEPHTVTVNEEGVKIVKKGCRNGMGMSWKDLRDGVMVPVATN